MPASGAPDFRDGRRGIAATLPLAATVVLGLTLWPFLSLPAWSARAPFLIGRAAIVNLLATVAGGAVFLAFRLLRRRSGPGPDAVAAVLAVGACGALPLAGPYEFESFAVAGRILGCAALVAGALVPVRRRSAVAWASRAALALAVAATVAAIPPRRPDLVLVTVDTLRADRVNDAAFADLAPNLGRFAASGVRFSRAWSTAPWTIPAMSSIFTGVHPAGHGARSSGREIASDFSRARVSAGGEEIPNPFFTTMSRHVETLPQALARGGYATVGFSDWIVVSRATGFGRGFGRFDQTRDDADSDLVQDVRRWLRDARPVSVRPYFLFVHLLGPHHPYEAPAEFVRPVLGAGGALDPHRFEPFEAKVDGASLAQEVMREMRPLPPHLLRHVSATYDGEVRYVDHNLEVLLSSLDDDASAPETLVAITSDHGEFLGERCLFDHAHFVYEEVSRVPLLVRFPRSWGERPGVHDDPVSNHDVYPTFLAAAGVTARHRLTARDLRAAGPGRTILIENGPNVAMTELFGDRFAHGFEAVTDGRWKWILTDGAREELYDLSADPRESRDVAAAEPGVRAGLARFRESFRRQEELFGRGDAPAFSGEDARKLRGLGYLR